MGGKGSHGVIGNKGGRPRKTMSEKALSKLYRAFERKAKEHGKDVADLLAEWAYSKEMIKVQVKHAGKMTMVKRPMIDIREKLRCVEIYLSHVITRKSEQVIEQKKINIVEMPKLDDDPAKKIIEEKKIEFMGKEFIQ